MTARIIILAVCALALVYLTIRYARKRRSQRSTSSGASPVAAPHLMNEERYAAAAESRAYRDAAKGRQIFATVAVEANPLPAVAPEDVPHADMSECTFGRATPVLASLLPESPAKRETVKKELQAAGYYSPYAWHNLAATRYLLMMGAILFFGTLLLFVPRTMETGVILTMIGCAIVGWSVPRLMVRGQGRERLGEIERGMPDMLDMLNMSVSQGMTVHEGLSRISGQLKPVYPALAQELRIVSEQADVGSLEQALTNFGKRIDLPEVHSFATLVTQTERMGTSISDALSTYADNMREGLRQRADQKANAASFKLLFPTVLFLMPAVFIFLLGPAIIELSDFFGGSGREMLIRNRSAVQDYTERGGR